MGAENERPPHPAGAHGLRPPVSAPVLLLLSANTGHLRECLRGDVDSGAVAAGRNLIARSVATGRDGVIRAKPGRTWTLRAWPSPGALVVHVRAPDQDTVACFAVGVPTSAPGLATHGGN